MNSDALICFICYEPFDLDDRLPRILPDCGHTLCSYCLTNILKDNGRPRCPKDKIEIDKRKEVKSFPVNYSLRDMLDQNPTQLEVCQEHKRKKEYICTVDNQAICYQCAVIGSHFGHRVTHLNDITSKLAGKVKYVNDASVRAEKSFEEVWDTTCKAQTSLTEAINSSFKGMANLLEHKKAILLYHSNLGFALQRGYISQSLGKQSNFQTKLCQMRADFKHPFRCEDPHAVIERELDQVSIELELTKIEESAQKINHTLNQHVNSWNTILKRHREGIASMEPPREFASDESTKANDIVQARSFTTETMLTFSIIEDQLLIETKSGKPRVKTIDISDFKNVQKVTLKITDFNFTHYDIAVFYHIWTSLEAICFLEISCCGQNEQIAALNQFLYILALTNNKSITELCVDFDNWEHINPSTMSLLTDLVLPTMTGVEILTLSLKRTNIKDMGLSKHLFEFGLVFKQLHQLSVYLNETFISDLCLAFFCLPISAVKRYTFSYASTKVTEGGLKIMMEYLLPYCQNLEHLHLNFDDTTVSGKALVPIFNSILHLRSLTLGLRITDMDDDLLKTIGSTLSNMPQLEELHLELPEDSTDEDLMTICVPIPSLKRLDFNLFDTEITDESLQVLSKTILDSAKSLETVILHLDGTGVTDSGVIALAEQLNNVRYLALHLTRTKVTDTFAVTFANELLPQMKSLVDFDLHLSGTQVTESVLQRIKESKEALKIERMRELVDGKLNEEEVLLVEQSE